MTLPLRIFVSHTSELADMVDGSMSWVMAADRAVADLRHAKTHMSLFGARDRRPVDVCIEELLGCQVWVGILGARYGSIEERSQLSYTELEFETANRAGLHRLAFVVDPTTPTPHRADVADGAARQRTFRARVSGMGLVKKTVKSPMDVYTGVYEAIRSLGELRPRPRRLHPAPTVVPYPLRGRQLERDALRASLESQVHRVVALTGPQGSGKTALAASLIDELVDADPRSDAVFRFIDYTSATGLTPVTGSHILLRLLEATPPGADRTRLEHIAAANPSAWTEQAEAVLGLVADDVLFVLDEAQHLLDESGRLIDRQLDRFVHELSVRDDHRITMLLVSSTRPSTRLIGYHRDAVHRVPKMLERDSDAVDLLNDMARRAGLSLPSDVSVAVQMVGRRPRSLELLVAALALTPEDTRHQLIESAGAELVDPDRALHRLLDDMPDDPLAVVRVLAVIGIPTTALDVADVMQSVLPEDFGPDRVVSVLRQLAASQLVHAVSRTGPATYWLPTEEAEHFVRSWRRDAAGNEGYLQLVRVVAHHLGRRKDEVAVRRVEDLTVHLREIALRLELDDQAERCIWLMGDLDHRYLIRWGQSHILMPWRRRLKNRPHDFLWRHNLASLAAGAAELDELDEASDLLRHLRGSWTDGSAAGTDSDHDLASEEAAILDLVAAVAYQDGCLADAQDWYRLGLQAARQPFDHVRALSGLGRCAKDLGRLDEAERQLTAAWTACHDVPGAWHDKARALVLLSRADLARIRGDSTAVGLAEQALSVARRTEASLQLRSLDLLAVLRLETYIEQGAPDELVRGAVGAVNDAADQAARTGLVDITRTIHAVLAFGRLRQGDLTAARTAAGSAASYFRTKRGLAGQLALGAVELRERRRPGPEVRARDAFWEAIRMGEQFPTRQGRPFWVWDAIGVAYAGLHLCRVDGVLPLMVEAFTEARAMVDTNGAVRRTRFYLGALTADISADLADALQSVADRPQDAASTIKELGRGPTRD